MRILIDGYNLSMPEGTGITTYARNLSHAVAELGHDPEILYHFPLLDNSDKLLQELSFFHPRDPKDTALARTQRRAHSAADLLKTSLGFSKQCSPVHIGPFVDRRGVAARLPSFSRLWTSPQVFQTAWTYFGLTGRFLPIRISPKPDVAHWTFPLPIFMPSTKNVYTVHDLIPLRLPGSTTENLKKVVKLIRRMVEIADRVVVISETTKQDLLDVAPRAASKIVNTYQALRPSTDQMIAPSFVESMLGLRPGQYFLFVSAIEPKKNLARLIQAYLGSSSNIPLVIVGRKGWLYEKELAPLQFQKIASGLRKQQKKASLPVEHQQISSALKKKQAAPKTPQPKIITLDYIEHGLLRTVMKSARALLFPSLYEGFGLPLLEAMELGVPIMTSNFGATMEIAPPDSAALVNPYDIPGMSTMISRLATDDEFCRDLAARALERAQSFSWEIYKAKIQRLYAEL